MIAQSKVSIVFPKVDWILDPSGSHHLKYFSLLCVYRYFLSIYCHLILDLTSQWPIGSFYSIILFMHNFLSQCYTFSKPFHKWFSSKQLVDHDL